MSALKHHCIVIGLILCVGTIALTGCAPAVGAAARSSIVNFASSVFNTALAEAFGG